MNLSFAQRFDKTTGNGGQVFASLSLGCPSMNIATDYSIFKKTDEETGKILTHKKNVPKSRGYKFTLSFKGAF